MKIQNVKAAVTARRNYDWLALAQMLTGFALTALPGVLTGKVLGYVVMALGALQIGLKWFREQQGLSGGDLPKVAPGDGQDSGV